MLLLVFTAMAGGVATAGLMWPQGALVSLLSAPIGGSLCALTAACLLVARGGATWREEPDLERQTDEMVAALRGIAARGGQPVNPVEREAAPDKAGRKVA